MSKEIPILFNTEMVKAVLAGQKTVTRRVIKLPDCATGLHWEYDGMSGDEYAFVLTDGTTNYDYHFIKPRYRVGDLLYVRERIDNGLQACNFYYHADNKGVGNEIYNRLCAYGWKLKKVIPGIHMPKWAARIWLEVVSVKPERSQDITWVWRIEFKEYPSKQE